MRQAIVILKAVAFLASVALIFILLGLLLHSAGISLHSDGAGEGPKTILNTLVLCAIAFGTTIGFARLERRSPFSYGIADPNVGRLWGWGAVTGAGAFAVLIIILARVDAIRFEPARGSVPATLTWGLFWLGCYFAVAVAEEILFRGYLLSTLASGLGWPVAILITSLLFGLAHLSNGFESPLAAVNGILLGAVLAWSVRRSGSLWWAIGLHTGWDWAESYVAGAADSGVRAVGRLMTAVPSGSLLWSGGTAGPEGSVAMLGPIILAAFACVFTLRRSRDFQDAENSTPPCHEPDHSGQPGLDG